MLKDFKFLRRHSVGNNTEDVENLTTNPRDSPNPQIRDSPNPFRPPLNTIQEPSRIPKRRRMSEDFSGFKPPNKVNRTPTHPKPKYPDTPEKQGAMSKHRLSWAAQKGEHLLSDVNVNTPRSAMANLGYSEFNSTQTIPPKSVSKPPNPGFSFTSRMANHAALYKGTPSSCSLATVLNAAEVPCFKLKEDPSFTKQMEHSVQVLIRVRPLNNMEKSRSGQNKCVKQESAQSITFIGQQPQTLFTYDHVAGEAIDQGTFFSMAGLPMVENCLLGYNSCMFAYGQTGSGKTHTMLGEIGELEVEPSPNRGMTPRIFEYLFGRIREEEASRREEHLKYNCKCSFLEIYNEQITDLLDPSSTNLMIREDMKKGVYVDNLSEFEVHTVGDILQLLTQGASNRKVAATNMNRESSRSHSVFTCVIESTWEKDSATNFRFARLNLVDLAGSERQKSSGTEGERLKEAANINKSLSALGHVIMVLVDIANGKPRHIPYRDSRLTFLLQDSLGGNSKTMIIANVSPSICSAAETFNTLKFAQRAKLIQNNAIINEDSSGDIMALKHQIYLLKEELSALKREKVTRSLSFGGINNEDDDDCSERTHGKENGVLKSLETTLAGALRREQMAETTVRQLQVEIQQLNRLVSQREEDTKCRKMVLKFREDKIQRMESVLGGIMPIDDYLVRENKALLEENQLLRERVDKNPEVTRFAFENIRPLDQVPKFRDLYEEGEKEMLTSEVRELRNQLISSLDGNLKHFNHLDMKDSNESNHNNNENDLLHKELKITLSELEGSKEKLNCCLEENAKLQREIEKFHALLSVTTEEHDCNSEVINESIEEVPMISNLSIMNTGREKEVTRSENLINVEDIMHLQLELDIVKIILREQMSSHAETEESTKSLKRELQLSKETIIFVSKDYEGVLEELKKEKSVIEALESEKIQMINEIEEKELEISNLKHAESEYSSLEARLSKLQYQEESFMIELLAKDFELLILSSDLKEEALLREEAEKACITTYEVFENLKKDILFKSLEAASCELMLMEKENEYEVLLGDLKMKESSLGTSSIHISELDQKIQKLQNELEIKNGVFGRINCLEKENQELSDIIVRLEEDLTLAKVEIENHNVSQCIVNTLQEENTLLRKEVGAYEINRSEYLNFLNLKVLKNADLTENLDKASCKIINLIEEKFVEVEDKFQSIVNEMDNTYNCLGQFECVENIALKLDSEISSLEMELSRKDDIIKGLLFDLSLLQESASSTKDKKDEMEKVLASLSVLERDFELKSFELEKSVAEGQSLFAQLQEKMEKISALEIDLSRSQDVINTLSRDAKKALDAKNSTEKEFVEARMKIEGLETEVADMKMAICQMDETNESLKGDLDVVTHQRNELRSKVFILSKEFETGRALAEENEAIAIEAQEVDIVSGEAEGQLPQTEELEVEFLGVNNKDTDSDLKSFADEKDQNWSWKRPKCHGYTTKLTVYNRKIQIGKLFEVLSWDPLVKEEFDHSCFAIYKQLDMNGLICTKALHALMGREINLEDATDDELWFRVGGVNIRFSKVEFALTTGLRFGGTTFDPTLKHEAPIDGIYKRLFEVDKPSVGKILERFSHGEFDSQSVSDRVKIMKILFVYLFILGVDTGKRKVDMWVWKLIEDDITWEMFPWGSYGFQTLVRHLRAIPLERKWYHAYGCTFAFICWAYEAIPELAEKCATRIDGVQNKLPRVLRWKFLGNLNGDFEKVLTEKVSCLPMLEPLVEEEEAYREWWTAVTVGRDSSNLLSRARRTVKKTPVRRRTGVRVVKRNPGKRRGEVTCTSTDHPRIDNKV